MPSKRRYVSPLREQAAARTRALILGQATELFAEHGYGRVTVADIASAAGVASKTVFASVGSKSDILNRIVDQGVIASGYEQAMEDLLALRTPESVLKALAHGTRMGNEGSSPCMKRSARRCPCMRTARPCGSARPRRTGTRSARPPSTCTTCLRRPPTR